MESLTVSRTRLSTAKEDMSEGKARTHEYHHLVRVVRQRWFGVCGLGFWSLGVGVSGLRFAVCDLR